MRRPSDSSSPVQPSPGQPSPALSPGVGAPLLGRWASWALAVAGWMTLGVAVSLVIASGLGVDAYSTLGTGVAAATGLSVAAGFVLVGMGCVALAAVLGVRPRWGTIGSAVGVSTTVGLVLPWWGEPGSLSAQLGLFTAGCVVIVVGIVIVVASDTGAGPPEQLMLALHRRGAPLAVARWGMEGTMVGAAVLLGGEVGLGTLVLAVVVGPSLHLVLPAATRWRTRLQVR